MRFEFIYSSKGASSTVFQVEVDAPERIVYMPVPSWVIESIWQGEINGSFHFESDARELIDQFTASLQTEANASIFGVTNRVGRDS